MTDEEKLASYEAMHLSVLKQYEESIAVMATQKAMGRERSVTYRQMLGNKLRFSEILALYRQFGLENPEDRGL